MENNLENVSALEELTKGFYVNVTTVNSTENPIFKVLYEKGWRGINIHPNREFINQITIDRPEDININAVITDYNGYGDFSKNSIAYRSLDLVLDEYEVEEIHFLGISVNAEDEKKVLEGLFLTDLCPHVLMIEFNPDTDERDVLDCENLILEKAYQAISFNEGIKLYFSKKYNDLSQYFQNIFCSLSDTEFLNLNQEQDQGQLKKSNDLHQKMKEQKLSFFELVGSCLKRMCALKLKKRNLNVEVHCKEEEGICKSEKLLETQIYEQISLHYSKITNKV